MIGEKPTGRTPPMYDIYRDQLIRVLDILEYLKDFDSTGINTRKDNVGLYGELSAVLEGTSG